MYLIRQIIVVCMVLVLLIGCAGQTIRNNASSINNGCNTAREDTAKQWDENYQNTETFYERNRHIITDVFLATLVVAEIALFWYLVDEYHDSKRPFLWIGPLWPWWY